jgi:hypothetical protein
MTMETQGRAEGAMKRRGDVKGMVVSLAVYHPGTRCRAAKGMRSCAGAGPVTLWSSQQLMTTE